MSKKDVRNFVSKYENSVNTFCEYCNALWMYIVCGVFFILLFVCMFVFSFCVLPFWWIKMYILIYCGSYCLRKSNKKADEKWLFWTHLVYRLYQRDRRTKTPICHTDNVGEHNIYGDEERNFIRMGGVNRWAQCVADNISVRLPVNNFSSASYNRSYNNFSSPFNIPQRTNLCERVDYSKQTESWQCGASEIRVHKTAVGLSINQSIKNF